MQQAIVTSTDDEAAGTPRRPARSRSSAAVNAPEEIRIRKEATGVQARAWAFLPACVAMTAFLLWAVLR
ncbi:hypothetical protein [Dongia deserti]|uniref:hypothetical protein n=1 Tax=Dongia deserti TaxID=2268030 RepID=UPI0013C4C25E|nr:hypothetical protein [Dongia deserti]